MKSHKIDKKYYESSTFFENDAEVFTNLESSFQKYRISKVCQIYTPKKNEKVLDLGCGWGTFCFVFSPLCKKITGVDFSRKSIGLCQKLLAQTNYKNINFICRDGQETKLKSGSYDVVICADLVEHLYPDIFEKVLEECNRVLKKGGKLIIWTPNRGHILEILKNHNIFLKKIISHVDYKSMNSLIISLKKKSFLIKKSYYTESHLPIFSLIEKVFLRFTPLLRRRIAILAEKKGN
jgi:2-polyprenyl-3-methyl-5-hydroxy-6-metoxy-1,4-benzoquinol methylase